MGSLTHANASTGDVRCLADAEALMAATGADGVMSAEPLLNNPMLFDPSQPPEVSSSRVCLCDSVSERDGML